MRKVKYYRSRPAALAAIAFRRIRAAWLAGPNVLCPCCRQSARRFIGGETGSCPNCGSQARHRLIRLWLDSGGLDPLSGTQFLHFAPEACLENGLRAQIGSGYVSVDLTRPDVDVQSDICQLLFPDESFDITLLTHVLEHIPDDRTAMSELNRVLRPGGTAVIQVPGGLRRETYEDASAKSDADRKRLFGQEDHCRIYGLDITLRLQEAGFEVSVIRFFNNVPQAKRLQYGIWDDPIFVARKGGMSGSCRRARRQ